MSDANLHLITVKEWRGRRSAACTCGARWAKVGSRDAAHGAGSRAMHAHADTHGAPIALPSGAVA